MRYKYERVKEKRKQHHFARDSLFDNFTLQ